MFFCEAKKVFRSITNLPLCHVCWKIDFKEGNDVRAQLRTAGPSEPDGTGDNPHPPPAIIWQKKQNLFHQNQMNFYYCLPLPCDLSDLPTVLQY